MPDARRVWVPMIAGGLAILVLETVLVMWMTGGHFVYTLDDPYVHLAVAENLARFGHYGINLEEYSSPSSSVLWPLLLVPFFKLGAGPYGPLVLNVVLALATLPLLHRAIVVAVRSNGVMAPSVSSLWALFTFFAIGGFGVVFTGMEHSLHVFVTVAIMVLVNRMYVAAGENRAPLSDLDGYLIVLGIVLSPLVRFEGLAVSAFTIAMLAGFGKPRLALLAAVLVASSLALYVYAMSALGLPWLPSSVLAKSPAAADLAADAGLLAKFAGSLTHVTENIAENLDHAAARLIVLIALLLAAEATYAWRNGKRAPAFYVAGVVAVIVLHLAFARFGWLGRYQSYLAAFTACAAIQILSGPLLRHGASRAKRLGIAAMAAVVILGLQQNVMPVGETPLAARNIYEQQYQMHAFVTRHWKAPVAVNDIGLVSFENDLYVLDLYGLASEEARQLGRARDPDLLPKMTGKRDIHLAMIYEDWFPGYIPADWRKIADLRLASARVITPYDSVSLFVFKSDRDFCRRAVERVSEFARTLQRPDVIEIHAEACERLDVADDARAGDISDVSRGARGLAP